MASTSNQKSSKDHNMTGVFRVEALENRNMVRIHHTDNKNLDMGDFIRDELIDRFNITTNVFGNVFACNITDKFLMSNKTLPIVQILICLEKPLKSAVLYKIALTFTIENTITSFQELIKTRHKGKFALEVIIDNQRRTLEHDVQKYPGEKALIEQLKTIISSTEMSEILNTLIKKQEVIWGSVYKKELEYFADVSKTTISLRNYKID